MARSLLLIFSLALAACDNGQPKSPLSEVTATYTGSAACQDCHEEAYAAWSTSHHAAAMQPATPEHVLATTPATLGDAILERHGERYALRVDGKTFALTHTFGVSPLQQYLVEAPGGRLQAFNYAWDARPAELGGQRWFDLYAEQAPEPGEAMHWQGRAHTWNHMCADCHATDLHKRYLADSDSYATQAAELTVGCEACHGPGSLHVGEPQTQRLITLSGGHDKLIDTCAPCHARRSEIAEGFRPGSRFLDHYRPALLQPPLYTTDAQIDDEVYVWGSFVSSRMYAQGVTCNHCHDPHTTRVLTNDNTLCTQCHSPAGNAAFPTLRLASYDSVDHHMHTPATQAAQCITCHMPERTYMAVDARRDHGFRVPRPDLGADTRSVCASCHAQSDPTQNNAWAARVIEDHFGPRRASNLATALHGGTEEGLSQLANNAQAPAMLRATALAGLANGHTWQSRQAIEKALVEESGLVRLGALAGVHRLPEGQRNRALLRASSDPLLAVRLEAVAQALAIPGSQVADSAVEEYRAAQMLNGDTPEAQVNMATLHRFEQDHLAAEGALKRALEIEPDFLPALVNLADVLRTQGREEAAGALLLRAARGPAANAEAAYAYGLWLVRNGRQKESIEWLRSAAEIAPDNPLYVYAYALALDAAGKRAEAISVIELAASGRHARDGEVLFLAATLRRDAGDRQTAARWARRLSDIGDPRGAALLRQLAVGSG